MHKQKCTLFSKQESSREIDKISQEFEELKKVNKTVNEHIKQMK